MNNVAIYIQVALGALTVIGAGIGSYVGIKVSQAEMKGEVNQLKELNKLGQEERQQHDKRLRWLEERLFSSNPRN